MTTVNPSGSTKYYPVWYSKNNFKRTYYQNQCIFSLYPKEWLISEMMELNQDPLVPYDLSELVSIEPWWKLITANKAVLPLLWDMY